MAGRVDSRLYLRWRRATCLAWQQSAPGAPRALAAPMPLQTGMGPDDWGRRFGGNPATAGPVREAQIPR